MTGLFLTHQSLGEMSMVSLVYFHFSEAVNDAFEVHFFQGLIFTPYERR